MNIISTRTKRAKRFVASLFVVAAFSGSMMAQLSGTKNIPTDYPTLAAAIIDINTQGVNGPLVINVPAGFTETAPVGGYALTATGTAANTITFQKSGAGANPLLTAYTGTATPGSAAQDGVFRLVGSDYVTIDGIDITDPNTTNPATMEYGYALYKASLSDGCQFNTIKNCVITLNRINNASGTAPMVDGSVGINVMNATAAAATTGLVPTAAAGSNSNNKFYSNTIQNCNIGMALIGYAASSPFTSADTNNDIGGGSVTTGNTIINYGGGAATNPAAAIRTLAQYGLNVSYNNINNNNGSGVNHATTLRGIFINTAASANTAINSNTLSLSSGATTSNLNVIDNASGSTAASNTVSINNNVIQNCTYATATSGVFNGIINSGTSAVLNINGNLVNNISIPGTGNTYMIETGSPVLVTANNNTVTAIARSGASGTCRAIKTTSPGTLTVNNNLIDGISWTAAGSTGIVDCISSPSSATALTVNNNIIRNISVPGTSTVNGIRENGIAGVKTFQGNQIYNFSTTPGGAGGATFNGIFCSVGTIDISNNQIYALNSTGTTGGTSGTVYGIQISGATASNIYKNKIYNLSSTSTGPVISGVYLSGGTTNNLYNNTIGDLRAPAAIGLNVLVGINLAGGTTDNIYYNTVYLNGSSSGTTFGSSAVFANASPGTFNLQNNIFMNVSTATGTGLTAAFRKSSAGLTNYGAASNNNLFYAGTPSASNVIFYDGTTAQQTLAAYKTLAATRDVASVTENVSFASTTGSASNYLHITNGTATAAEGGAANISGFTDDFDGDIRQGNAGYAGTGTSPDIGADEFSGISPQPVINSVSITPTGNQCTAVSRNVTANVTPGSAPLTSVTLNYTYNGVAQTPITMTGGNLTSTSTWNATIPAATPSTATVGWTVVATDGTFTKSTSGTSYADAPLSGLTATAAASPNPVCAGSTTTLTALPPVTALFGAGTLTTTSSGTSSGNSVSPFSHYYGGGRFQYMIRASELTAQGITAGNINSVAVDVAVVGITYNGFAVNVTQTTNTDLSAGFVSGLVQVYSGNVTPVLGLNTYTFSSPYVWDGTSNLVIQMCWSNNNGGGTAAEVRYDNTPFVSEFYSKQDNVSPAAECSAVNVTGTNTARPKMILIQNKALGLSYTWSDGTSTVGTTSLVVVTPTANTTYSATLTDGNGCSITSAPVTVTVIPLPSAPTVTNSSQCGVGVPTAQVGGGSSYNWYATPTSTAVLQSGSGNTYTTSISSTTTFYVSSVSGACFSPRSAVTTTVSIPDGVIASTSASNLCPGGSATLTATQTGTNNPYVFSWTASPSAGSGIPTSVSGATAVVTPTIAGTYMYSVTATDGICTTVASVSVTLNNPPSITATANPTVICSGASVNLNATTPAIGNGTVALGVASTLTGATTQPTAFCNRWSSYRQQSVFTAAELSAAGLSAGNITSIAYNITTLGDAATNANFTVKCGTTTVSAFTDFVPSTGFTTVFPPATYTHAVGVNTINFSTPFNWDGVSNLVVEVSHDGANNINNAQTYYTATAGNMIVYSYNGGAVGTPSTQRLNVIFGGQAMTQGAGNLTWQWNPGAINSNTTTVNPVNSGTVAATQVYTITGTNTVTTCSNTATVGIVVNPLPASPVAFNSTQCGLGVSTASVSGGTSYKWYATPTSTAVIQSGSSATYTTSINSTTTFYVSSFNGTCESPRTALTETVTIPDPITASATPTVLCPGSSATLTATQTGTTNVYSFSWTASPSAGSGIPTSVSGATTSVTPTIPGTYVYTVTATDGVCTTVSSVSVLLNSAPLAPVLTPSTATSICLGSSQTITAVAGTNVVFTEPYEVFPFTQFTTTGTGVTTTQNSTYFQQGANSAMLTYATGADGQLAMTSNINLSSYTNPKLTFYQICATEPGYDYGYVQYSTDGGVTWTSFPTSSYSGAATLKNGVVSFDNSSYSAWSTQFTSSTSTPGTGPATALWKLETIDLTAYQASSQFRVRFRLTSDGSVNYYGWLIDNVTISAQSPANFAWTSSANSGLPGSAGTPSAANGSVTVTPTAAGAYVYTATATNAAGCTSPSAMTATLTVNPLPTAPVATNSIQCGFGVPTASVSGGTSYNWYASPTSTTVIQSGSSANYTTAINSTTTFYVASFNGNCESSTRTAVTESVTIPDGVTASATSTAVCPNGSTTLTATQTGTNNPYVFTWTASPSAGSGIPTSAPGKTVTVTPNTPGTYVYSVTASDGVCTTISSVNVLVNNIPNISNAAASPSVLCSGNTTTLSAISINAIASTTTVGTSSLTDYLGGPYRQGAGTDNKAQWLFTAAELTAAGIAPGNITAISFNVPAGSTDVMNNFTIRMGSTATTAFATTFDAAPAAVVYGPASVSATTGVNTYSFTTPFNWNGTSNIVIQVCHDVVTAGGGSTGISMSTTSNKTLYAATTGACAQTAGSTTTNRPFITFAAQVGSNVSSSVNWMWNPGAIPSNTAVVTPVNPGTTPVTQTYTITATDPVTTCTNSAMASVTVNPLPATPSVFNSVQCGVAVPTASVSGGTSYNWYNAATSGTLVQSGTSQTYTGSISSTTIFYVSSFNGTCESPRAALTASVNSPDAITASVSSASICPNTAATLSVTQTGSTNTYSYTWTASPAAGSGIPTSVSGSSVMITPTLSGTYVYTVTGVDGACTAVSTTTLNVFLAVTTPPTASAAPNPVCAGSSVTLTGVFSGATAPSYSLPPAVSNATTDEDLGNVTFGPLNNTTAINSLAGTIGTASGTAGSYSDFTAFGPYAVTAGSTYPLSVDVLQQTTAYSNAIGVYIDFNRNGVFTDAGEAVYVSPGTTPGAHTETALVTIPATAQSGLTRMRVLVNEGTVTGPTMGVSYGEYEEYMLNIQPNVTYSWTDGTSTVGTTNPLVLTPAGNTTYSFSITDGNGCSINSTAVTVTVAPIPTVTAISSATSVCAGSTAILTAGGATNYTWTPGNQTLASIVVAPIINTTYTVTGANSAGCSSTATVALAAIPLPTVTATASNTVICSGTTVTITANGASSYTWTPGSLNTTTIAVTPTVTNNYTVNGSNGTCTGSGTIHITVNNVPTLSVTPASTTICAGSTATLTGSGATSYSWSTGSATNTAVVTPTASTTYTLTGTNSCGTSTIAAMVSTVTTPTVTAVASSSVLCSGSSATITASGAATYSWSPGGATTSTVSVITPTANATYTVRGTNACGTASAVTTITVNPTPTVTAVSTRTSICTGDFAVLTASGATNYTWTPGGATTSSISVTPTVTTTYMVTGKTAAGCTATATVNQLVLPCTGIDEASSAGIDIYPNPNVGSVNVSIPGELIGRSSIQVYDAIGKLVIRENLTDAMTHLNTSRLEEGLYIYKIFDNNGVVVKIGRMVRNK